LAAAYESKADYLVSLDRKHLLPLKHYHGTQILTPALFIKAIDTNKFN
jgi:predicted nucleic acid-binding protein